MLKFNNCDKIKRRIHDSESDMDILFHFFARMFAASKDFFFYHLPVKRMNENIEKIIAGNVEILILQFTTSILEIRHNMVYIRIVFAVFEWMEIQTNWYFVC